MTQGPDGQVSSLTSRRLARRSWARRHKFLAALLPALVLGLAVVITVTVRSGGGGTTSASHPVGSKAASAQEAAAVTKGAKWLAGPAGKTLKTVNADLVRLSTAERAGKRDAAKIAGTQLATDAKAALSGPMPPAESKVYRSALKDFERAGTYTARRDSGKAAPLLYAGYAEMTKVTAAENPPATVNGPAPVNEPNGQ
jgi:hypothetical protein